MKRVTKSIRLAAVAAALWLVAGADWPADQVMDLLGDMGCC